MGRRDKPGQRILRKRETARDLPNAPRLSSRERPQGLAGRVGTVRNASGGTDKAEFLAAMSWSDQYPDAFDMFLQNHLDNMGIAGMKPDSSFSTAMIAEAPMFMLVIVATDHRSRTRLTGMNCQGNYRPIDCLPCWRRCC